MGITNKYTNSANNEIYYKFGVTPELITIKELLKICYCDLIHNSTHFCTVCVFKKLGQNGVQIRRRQYFDNGR